MKNFDLDLNALAGFLQFGNSILLCCFFVGQEFVAFFFCHFVLCVVCVGHMDVNFYFEINLVYIVSDLDLLVQDGALFIKDLGAF